MRRVRELALTAGAVVGVLCLLWTAAVALLGVTPLVLTSGSMEPAISTGDLALARSAPAGDLERGDVVSVSTDGVRVTHRVTDVQPAGGQFVLTLKGDANRAVDSGTYQVSSADRVFATIPRGGYVIAAVGSPLGVVIGGLLVAGLLVLAFGPSAKPRGGRRRAHVVAGGLVLVVLAAGSQATPVETTLASFTDDASLTTGSFAAHTVLPPSSASCTTGLLGLLSATISWPEKDPRYDYEVVLHRVTSPSGVVSTRQVTGSSVSTTYSGLSDFNLGLGVLGTVDFRVEIRSKLATSTSWQSSTVRTYSNIRVVQVLIVGATMSCTT